MLSRITFALIVFGCNVTFAQTFGQYLQNSARNVWQGHHNGAQQQVYQAQQQAAQRRALYQQQTAAKREAAIAKKAYEREQKQVEVERRKMETAYKAHLLRMEKDPVYAAEIRRREKEGLVMVGVVAAFLIGAAITADSFEWKAKSDEGEDLGYGSDTNERDYWAYKTRVWRLEGEIRNATSDEQRKTLQAELDAVR